MADDPRRDPLIIEIDTTPLPGAPSPAEAPPPPDPLPASPAVARAIGAAGRRRGGLGRLLLWVLSGLVLIWIGVALGEFIDGLLTRHGLLGWIAFGLVCALVVLAMLIALREVFALARLGRLEALHAGAAAAPEDPHRVAGVLAGLDRLYRGRAELDAARAALKSAEADTPDPAGRLELAERLLMSGLDAEAEAVVRRASRDVAVTTALVPLALVDILAALVVNLRMIRRIAEIYGGRSGWLGSWRLLRAVAGHIVATGAIAVGDDVLGPLIGGGVLAKLSRRFGEGALNGTLTARVGVAAMEICRPMPFAALARPSASGIVLRALRAWRSGKVGQDG